MGVRSVTHRFRNVGRLVLYFLDDFRRFCFSEIYKGAFLGVFHNLGRCGFLQLVR